MPRQTLPQQTRSPDNSLLSLQPGSRLGPYEITAQIGAGGMGEVYRATDTKLGRQVAIKVLPAALAQDPDRLARFDREARTLATLNHPNIAAIHGLEESAGVKALVMELVEGPTLADRIAQGPVAWDEARPVARQIADALDAAHQQGIIHRDLKPANIKVRPDGTVKVLDFGLAKALDPGAASVASVAGASQSPTVTSPAMTQAGIILGTAAYMSPEQARGRQVDERADIWAFGCVLYEMLTGKRAFAGDDVSETIAAVLKSEPDWSRLPVSTSPDVRRLLKRALEKDTGRRLADIRDARLEIDEPAASLAATRSRRLTPERLLWSVVTALLAIALVMNGRSRDEVATSPDSQATVAPPRPSGAVVHVPATTEPASVEISPDGQWVVFVATTDGPPKLWLQPLSTDGDMRPLRGTEGATYPTWSPDSRSICFFTNEQLYRLDVDGGVPEPVVFAPVGTGCTWGDQGLLLYTAVPDAGVSAFPPPARSENGLLVPTLSPGRGQRFPQFLPDRRHFLYYEVETRAVMLGSINSPERRQLFAADAAPEVVPPNEVLFVLNGALYVQTFDPTTFVLTGSRRKLGDNVAIDGRGAAAISASSTGAVLFRTGSGEKARKLTEVARDGTIRRVLVQWDAGALLNPNLSPDGTKLIFNKSEAGNTDIVELDLARLVPTSLTTAPTPEITPLYLYGGGVVFSGPPVAPNPPGFSINRLARDGSPLPPLPIKLPGPAFPVDVRRDGTLLFRTPDPQTGWDLWTSHVEGKTPTAPLLNTDAVERIAQFSPDGKWFTYELRNRESNVFEIFVQSYPPRAGTRKQVSSGGGSQPRWVGHEIFYVSRDGFLTSVSAVPSPDGRDLALGVEGQKLFRIAVESTVEGGIQHTYAVYPDGQRFIVSSYVELPAAALRFIVHRTRGNKQR